MAEETGEHKEEKLFPEIGEVAEDNDARPTEIESYCMNCGQNGITKLLLTKIPHWKEIVIMSFNCEHCGLSNNEVQFAGIIAEDGCAYTCKVNSKEDLDRQLVKSETASVRIPELDLEIPATTKKGRLTTIEGLVSSIVDDLSADQPARKSVDEEVYNKIDAIIQKLSSYLENNEEFSIVVDDPAGNSYIENLVVSGSDPKLQIRHYNRTREMNVALGLAVPSDGMSAPEENDDEIPEVMNFPANCSNCAKPTDTKMHVLNIPHFKEVVIMSTACDFCGYKSNEIKAGGPISPTGKRIILKMEDVDDLSRDILKSETCGLSIPEVDLELQSGTLGGRFTTVEGLLRQIYDELKDKISFVSGDSVQDERRIAFENFMKKLDKVVTGESFPAHLILDDPLSNSYLQNPYAPDPDPNMKIEVYERSFEQNEFLGLNDMVLENYGESN